MREKAPVTQAYAQFLCTLMCYVLLARPAAAGPHVQAYARADIVEVAAKDAHIPHEYALLLALALPCLRAEGVLLMADFPNEEF